MIEASVIVPIGRADGLAELQLRALAGQQGAPPFEVVLSLNNSDRSDRATLERILAGLGDDRFRVVDSSDRRGASHARNVGAHAAKTDALAFCDADDIVEPSWLRLLVDGLVRYDAVGGYLEEDQLMPAGQHRWRPPATPGGLPEFLGAAYLVSASLAIKRAAFDAVGGFDETLHRCEDIAITFALLDQGYAVGYIHDAVVHYRHRAGLKALVSQHYHYGRGMSQVLNRYGLPAGARTPDASGVAAAARRPTGVALLRPNRHPAQGPSAVKVLRRAGTLSGRVVGLVEERLRKASQRA